MNSTASTAIIAKRSDSEMPVDHQEIPTHNPEATDGKKPKKAISAMIDDHEAEELDKLESNTEGLDLASNDSTDASDNDKSYADMETNDDFDLANNEASNEEPKKKKKKRKPRSARPPRPTGFEEYYVDAPVTPAEYLQEKSLYSPEKSFSDRFSTAITRYTARRKFSQARSIVFDKYLAYGGIGTGIKQFQGGVDENATDKTAKEVVIEKSKYVINEEIPETSIVDFDAVVRGFLTSYLPSVCGAEDVPVATNVIRNFLNYLVYHEVCPEFADQIYDAKKSCDVADQQMPICTDLVHKLPGFFNKACSIIFGGQFQDTYIEDVEQAKSLRLDPGMRREQANKIFLAGFAAHGTEEMVKAYNTQAKENNIIVVSQKLLYLEVTATCPPSNAVMEMYCLASQRSNPPTGTVKFQTWQHPHGPWPEMTPEEVRAYKVAPYKRDHYELTLEVDLLPKMLVGTKICCTCYETSFGLRYFDSITGVLSPMYTWLDNDAIMDWVEPKEIPLKSKEDISEDDNYVVVGGNIPEDDDMVSSVDRAASEEDDVPPELQKYEKGEDIIVTI